jgi:hypothetical protein
MAAWRSGLPPQPRSYPHKENPLGVFPQRFLRWKLRWESPPVVLDELVDEVLEILLAAAEVRSRLALVEHPRFEGP